MANEMVGIYSTKSQLDKRKMTGNAMDDGRWQVCRLRRTICKGAMLRSKLKMLVTSKNLGARQAIDTRIRAITVGEI